MTIVLDHTIVAVADKQRSARLLADLIGGDPGAPMGPFVPVEVNPDLTLDFDDRFGPQPGHYAFRVDDALFDHALKRAVDLELDWGSAPRVADRQVDASGAARRVYVRDPDGVAYEFFTMP
jgi:catechol 2,3-dioxygenase-like lactoylglutathione lyase family enzyme